jgi:hypothetical protein
MQPETGTERRVKRRLATGGALLWAALASVAVLAGAAWLILGHAALSDCMGFYHAAVARLYAQQGIVTTFPAIPFSELAEHFVDQHFLYNFLLAPFFWFTDDGLLAVKLMTLMWLFALLTVFALMLLRFKLPGGFWLVLLLAFGVYLFSARMLMPRPMIASAVFLLAFHWALWTRRPLWLFVIAFFYGWLYHASIQILASAFLFVILARLAEGKWSDRLLTAPLFGLVLAFIVNPFAPQSLSFFIRHTFFMSHGAQGVALPAEWVGFGLVNTVIQTWPVLLLIGILLLPYAILRRKPSLIAVHLLLMCLMYLAGAVKAVRFFEYFGLFPPLAIGFLLRDMPDPRRWLPGAGMAALVLLTVVGVLISAPKLLAFHEQSPFFASRMEGAAAYLNANTTPGETVFNVYSGDFPELLYLAPDRGYTEGHNHTLMAYYDSKRYKTFLHVLLETPPDAAQLVRSVFNARYVVVSRLSSGLVPGMMDAINAGRGFTVVYRDKEALVARVDAADPNSPLEKGNQP